MGSGIWDPSDPMKVGALENVLMTGSAVRWPEGMNGVGPSPHKKNILNFPMGNFEHLIQESRDGKQ